MKIFSLLQIQYNQLIKAVKSYVSKALSDKKISFGNATIFGQIINTISAVVQNIILYIEDSLTEQNKYTAQRKKSIYGLAALSGYQPSYGKAAGVQLKLNFMPNNYSNLDIILPNKTSIISTQNGLNYNIILPQDAIILSPERNNSTKYLYAVQGQFETQTFVSIGGKYYTQNFKFTGNFDIDYLEVYINNELWERVESIYDMAPDSKQYTTKISYLSGIDLIFGNDVMGRSLQNGDVIKIVYLVHDGESGNVQTNVNDIFVFESNLENINGEEIDGNQVFNITFATEDSCISGTDSETTEQVRQMIGLNSRGLVLASPENYKQLISRFSFCGYNRTWSERGSLIVNSLIIKNYVQNLNDGLDYFNLKETDFYLTSDQKQSIQNYIEESGNQLAGVTYNIFDPELCKYALYVYVTLKKSTSDHEYIKNQIRKVIGNFFADVNSDIFIPQSDIVHALKTNISELDGVNVYFLSEKNETAIQQGYYTLTNYKFDVSLNKYIKSTEIVTVYPGENPQLGLDSHGNIYLQSDEQFPVLMGGWDFLNTEGQEVTINDPLIIVIE